MTIAKQEIQDRAGGNASFSELLDHLDDKERSEPAIPQKVPKGSAESEALRELALRDLEHWQKTYPEIAREAGVDISRSYAYKIMSEHHNLGRFDPRRKPRLTKQDHAAWVQFADWALNFPIEALAFTDELWIEIDGTRGRQKITRPRGSNPYDFVVPSDKPLFTLMLSACVSLGHKGTLYIWEKETKEERIVNAQELQAENEAKAQLVAEKRKRATQPGTEEYEFLQEKNKKIKEYNAQRKPGEPRKRCRIPKWEFGEEIRERSAGEGFDWFMYRKDVLHPLVYPFLEAVSKARQMPIWLIEDNAGNHTQAARLDAEEAKARGIYRIPHKDSPVYGLPVWPANSPDINKIEPLWRVLKDRIAKYPRPKGQGRNEIERFKDIIWKEWHAIPQEVIDKYCRAFHPNLRRLKENGGKNNFNA